ncbi:MAG: hypothetical protein IKM11_01400 [Oscillospiraceae bacterium]|nr:hypothetical protein [Oscillospiraceae bacterium]
MKRWLGVFQVMLMLLLICGCGAEYPEENEESPAVGMQQGSDEHVYEFTKSVVVFDYPTGEFTRDINGWETKCGNVTIRFSGMCAEGERETAASDIITLYTALAELMSVDSTEIEIHVCDGSYRCGNFGGVLYTGIDELGTVEFAASLVQTVFGTEVSYSLCYALGVQLLGKAAEFPEMPVEGALTLCDSDPAYLDLNYACFLENYTDEETLCKVRTLALDFYRSLTQEDKTELFVNYSDALFRQHLNAYLTAHGKATYDNTELDGVKFYPCGGDVRLVWEDAYAVFYVYDDFEVLHKTFCEMNGVEDYMNSTYEDLRYIVASYSLQAAEMERLVGHLDQSGTEEKIPVLFNRDHRYGDSAGGVYSYDHNNMYLFAFESYAHEYVHYLTRGMVKTPWLRELFSFYYTERPGDPRIYWTAEKTQYQTTMSDDEIYRAVVEHLGRPLDFDSFEDILYLYEATLVKLNHFDRIKTNGSVIGKTSFAAYLVDFADEASMQRAVYYDIPGEVYGKSWDALIGDWQAKLETEYAWIVE